MQLAWNVDLASFCKTIRLQSRICVFCGLAMCLGKSVLAQCASDTSGSAPVTMPGSAEFQQEHRVILDVKVSKSGAVQDATVIAGPTTLRAAAISTASRWKPRHVHIAPTDSTDSRQTTLLVTFAPGKSVPSKIEEIAPPGVSGCGPEPRSVFVSRSGMQNRLLSRADPVYPPDAKAEHVGGTVVLHITVDESGSVQFAVYVSGPLELVPSAIEAVKQWKYQPYKFADKLKVAESTVEVNFVP